LHFKRFIGVGFRAATCQSVAPQLPGRTFNLFQNDENFRRFGRSGICFDRRTMLIKAANFRIWKSISKYVPIIKHLKVILVTVIFIPTT